MSRIEEWMDKLADIAVFEASLQPGELGVARSFIGEKAATSGRPKGPAHRGRTHEPAL